MPSAHRTQLLARAAALLASAGLSALARVVVEDDEGTRIELAPRPGEALEQPAAPPPVGFRHYSDLELRIVRALADGNEISTSELAERIGETCSAELRGVVKNLSDVGVVKVVRGQGVRLASSRMGESA